MSKSVLAVALVVATTVAVNAADNAPIQYPDNSQRYAYGYSNINWPEVRVQRGRACNIMLEPGENLGPTESNSVILDDRVRWAAVASRSGGGKLPDGKAVPFQWSVAVEPAKDAEDAWLTISTDRGRRYMLHLIPVARNSPSGEHLVSFFYRHDAPRMPAKVRRQAVAVRHDAIGWEP